jgi:endonuclease YncB( thermonuclease family)
MGAEWAQAAASAVSMAQHQYSQISIEVTDDEYFPGLLNDCGSIDSQNSSATQINNSSFSRQNKSRLRLDHAQRIGLMQPMREHVKTFVKRQAGALAIAGFLAWVLWLVGAPPADAQQPLVGAARVIDGDTIEITGVRVRLEGIDAPEAGQTCGRRLIGTWACGTAATAHLDKRIAGQEVRCENRGSDRYGRMLGVCYLGALDLNADLVRHGLAWAFLKYSRTYVDVEAEARALRVGIWQGDATPAWEHRRQAWETAGTAAPNGCAIKGNVSRSGHIYHTPWSPWYGKVSVDERRGERWFCSEAEAVAAGWRPASGR